MKSPEFLLNSLTKLIEDSLNGFQYHAAKRERNFREDSPMMIFLESNYLNFEKGAFMGHPWDTVGELFASTTAILRNRPQEFISRMQQSKNPELAHTIAREVLTAYTSNPSLPEGFFARRVIDYFK
jgi:hypothetical protein